MSFDITDIIIGAVSLLSFLISYFLVPYLKSKTTKEKWTCVINWAATFVEAAEVLYQGSGQQANKRNYVLQCIRDECAEHNITYSETEIRAALEANYHSLFGKTQNKEQTITEE